MFTDTRDALKRAAVMPQRDVDIEGALRRGRRLRLRRRLLGTGLAAMFALGVGAVVLLPMSEDDSSESVAADRYRNVAKAFSVELPPGWDRAVEVFRPSLEDPVELISVGTGDLNRQPGPNDKCDRFGVSLDALGPDDALVSIMEYSPEYPAGFPQRPDQFVPGPAVPMESDIFACANGTTDFRAEQIDFSDSGRNFTALVVLGLEATSQRESKAYGVLDSFRPG